MWNHQTEIMFLKKVIAWDQQELLKFPTKLITKLKINFIENFHHVMHFASFPLAQRKAAITEKNSMLHLAEPFFFIVYSTPYSEIIVFCQGSS